MNKLITIIFSMVLIFPQDYDDKYVIIKLNQGVKRSTFKTVLNSSKYVIEKPLVKRLGIYKVRIIDSQLTAQMAVNEMRNTPWVEKAQLDKKVTLRQIFPNDSLFAQQWSKHNIGQEEGVVDADIDAPEAWDISTGGVNALGDTIVIAIIDDGMMLTHPDIAPNVWTNYNEIPDNEFDDDGNGYIDDIHGWNAYASDDSIPIGVHGTIVAGIIGAKGNNSSMMAGVNWDVKLMMIAGSDTSTSTVLEAYGYALDQRVLYDSTNGSMGAFIVATNSSFGIDTTFCNSAEYSLWNDVYNAMGELGILSIAATMNKNFDVDITGDVPTGCNSDYLIAVTNTLRTDNKHSGAAYGANSIDLGAPGTMILSTYHSGSTKNTNIGTSFSSAHVAGAVGLMHSVMTPEFAGFYKDNGAEASIILKQMILDGTDPLTSLDGITVSGGRLNLYNTALLVQNYVDCNVGDINGDQHIDMDDVENIISFILEYESPDDEEFCASDVDYDGEINISDVLHLVDIILGNP